MHQKDNNARYVNKHSLMVQIKAHSLANRSIKIEVLLSNTWQGIVKICECEKYALLKLNTVYFQAPTFTVVTL